ncbi:MAG: Trp family transcriptional regulator [bacterium]|nr:Trp family transcriptional regulator [bacterium]
MTQVSKYPISKEVYDRIFEIFLKVLVKIKDPIEAEEVTQSLLTPTERIMLAKRLSIAFLLAKGYKFREIQKVIKVSLATVASVNFVRQYGSVGYKKIIEKIMQEEKVRDFLEKAVIKILSAPASSTKGGGTWRYLKQEVEKEKEKNRKPF